MDYGLYVAHAKKPVHIGTAGECRAQVDLLSDEEKQSGWTIGPISEEPSTLPDDSSLKRQILIFAGLMVAMAVILAGVLLAEGYFQ